MIEPLPGIDAILFDVGGTLVAEAPPGTPVDQLRAAALGGVTELIPELARHHRLGAVTDTAVMDEQAVRKLLAPLGLDAVLDTVVTSADVGAPKPDPTIIERALAALGVAADRAVLVGNAPVDRQASRAAGVLFAATHDDFDAAIDRA